MAIKINSIVKAITPLVAASSGLVGLLGERISQNRNLASDERLKKREEDMLKIGEVLANAMEQLQATAQELRVQAELYESQRSRLRFACIFSVLALLMSAAALLLALWV
jgi:hypothetical protein